MTGENTASFNQALIRSWKGNSKQAKQEQACYFGWCQPVVNPISPAVISELVAKGLSGPASAGCVAG